MEFRIATLSNGLRIVHKPTKNGQVGHLGLTIDAGSRDEYPHEEGLAHFIEHCLFKGTKKRKAYHILNRMDSVGAELNAFTSKEETVLYASFLNVHFERAMEVIADIAFSSTFPEKELSKEKDVVFDEIQSYQDSPSELIFDEFEEMMFDDHPLAHNILGTEQTVKSFDSKTINEFIDRRYHCSGMVLSAFGNISFQRLNNMAERYFGTQVSKHPTAHRKAITRTHTERKVKEMDTAQAHMVIGAPSYSNHHPLRAAAILTNNYLGGPAMNSRLNMNIREKHGIAYNIESSYQPYNDIGINTIYLGTDKKMLEKSEALVRKELKNLRDSKLTTTALHRAKIQLKGQYALSQEGGGSTMLAIGKSLLSKNKVLTTKEVMERIEAISAMDVCEVANQTYAEDNLGVLIYH